VVNTFKPKKKDPSMDKHLISIIVPIYNVEKFLIRCIESLVNQTYKDIEIYLVDDGSTDNCPQICDTYAKKDPRIKVIHKENGGLSDARNVAIDVYSGEFILFVDSDDFIASDTVELLYTTMAENNSDISTCSFINHYKDDATTIEDEINHCLVLDKEPALENMLYQHNVTTSAWGKLYKKSLFASGIRYPKGKICEDLDTTYKLFSLAKSVTINSSRKFYYQQRLDSIINAHFTKKRMDALDFAQNQLEFIRTEYPAIVSSATNRYFMEAIFIITQIPFNQFEDERKKCKNIIELHRWTVLMDKKSRLIYRFYALLSLLGVNNLVSMYNIKSKFRSNIERSRK
jgi:glycosyltransferase involved in cell wall biosynthesis